MEFYVVATDLETGKAVYHEYEGWRDHGFDWILASASMPFVSKIVEIDGAKLLDGGVADSVPVEFFESIGYDRNLVILTQPEGYVKKKNPLMPLGKMLYRKYPKFIEAMANRHTVYNNTLSSVAEKEKKGELFVIRPDEKLAIAKAEKDPEKLKMVYELGRSKALSLLPQIKEYLQQ